LRERQQAIVARIGGAIAELERINARAETADRLGLLGSACKRLAFVQTEREARRAALLDMARHYRAAYDRGGASESYAFNNWAIACLVLAGLDPAYEAGGWRPVLADLVEQQRAKLQARAEEDPSLWGSTGLADVEVVRLLLAADDADACERHAERAAALYGAAFERGASQREIASIEENLEFLVALSAEGSPRAAEAVERIRRSL
jgi:hypothetical protein